MQHAGLPMIPQASVSLIHATYTVDCVLGKSSEQIALSLLGLLGCQPRSIAPLLKLNDELVIEDRASWLPAVVGVGPTTPVHEIVHLTIAFLARVQDGLHCPLVLGDVAGRMFQAGCVMRPLVVPDGGDAQIRCRYRNPAAVCARRVAGGGPPAVFQLCWLLLVTLPFFDDLRAPPLFADTNFNLVTLLGTIEGVGMRDRVRACRTTGRAGITNRFSDPRRKEADGVLALLSMFHGYSWV